MARVRGTHAPGGAWSARPTAAPAGTHPMRLHEPEPGSWGPERLVGLLAPAQAGPDSVAAAVVRRAWKGYVAGGLFCGSIEDGAALPSVRAMARCTGLDAAVVRQGVRALVAEGLAEEVGPGRDLFARLPQRLPPLTGDIPPAALESVVHHWVRGAVVHHLSDLRGRLVFLVDVRLGLVGPGGRWRRAVARRLSEGLSVRVDAMSLEELRARAEGRGLPWDVLVTTPYDAGELLRSVPPPGPPVVTLMRKGTGPMATRGEVDAGDISTRTVRDLTRAVLATSAPELFSGGRCSCCWRPVHDATS